MSDAIAIPNVVGRMDEFTKAAARGDKPRAMSILLNERSRRLQKMQAAARDDNKDYTALGQIDEFRILIGSSDAAWLAARRACGWTGDDAGAATGANVLRVDDFKEGDEIHDGGKKLCYAGWKGGRLAFRDNEGFEILIPKKIAQEWLDRGLQVYHFGEPVSGWPADKHPAVEEAARQRDENAKLKAEAGESKDYHAKYLDLMSAFAIKCKEEVDAKAENTQLKSEIERLKAAADEPKYSIHDMLVTTWSYLTDERIRHQSCREYERASNLLISAIEVFYKGAPAGTPIKLKK